MKQIYDNAIAGFINKIITAISCSPTISMGISVSNIAIIRITVGRADEVDLSNGVDDLE
jgi:hypothetical protein